MPNPVQLKQKAFAEAAEGLMAAWLAQLGEHDPIEGLAVLQALSAGAILTVSASGAPSTRAWSMRMSMTDTRGETSTIATLEL